jgi:hypothetical protein
MAQPTKHAWMADLRPGQSRTIPDTPANRMAVSYWKRRSGLHLRTRSLSDGQMLVECIEDTTVILPLAVLTPYACKVLAEEMYHQEEDALAELFASIYAELTGEVLSFSTIAETKSSQ